MNISLQLALLLIVAVVQGLARPSEDDVWKQAVPGLLECIPGPNRYKIADSKQCDKYYICDNGRKIPQLCPDGTAFQFSIQSCVLLSGADCSTRPFLQESQHGLHCPKRTGLFPHEDRRKCNQYYQCLDGKPTLITCPELLLFDPIRGVCDFEDLVDSSNCDLPPYPISCPSSIGLLPTFVAHPSDCNKFFLCDMSSKIRPLACEDHQGFDLKSHLCIDKKFVPRCNGRPT